MCGAFEAGEEGRIEHPSPQLFASAVSPEQVCGGGSATKDLQGARDSNRKAGAASLRSIMAQQPQQQMAQHASIFALG